MIKRDAKRRIRSTASTILSVLLIFLLIILGVLGLKTLLPLLKTGINGPDNGIIKPIGDTTTISDLSKRLNDKNVIVDSLQVSSISGTLIGQVRDGPIVYFSDSESADWQVNSLVLIMSHTSADNKKPVLVDLRNARPIVKF